MIDDRTCNWILEVALLGLAYQQVLNHGTVMINMVDHLGKSKLNNHDTTKVLLLNMRRVCCQDLHVFWAWSVLTVSVLYNTGFHFLLKLAISLLYPFGLPKANCSLIDNSIDFELPL